MTPDPVLELSVEQHISALNKKLSLECTRLQQTMPLASRALAATLKIKVDTLEKQAQDILPELISLWNSIRPVNRLPPEVIALCTTFVPRTDPRPIVSLTHVCRYWRKAIISNPRSWAWIGSGWKRLVPLCLERAGAVPLTVNIKAREIQEDEDFHRALPPHASRISHLSLKGYNRIKDVVNDFPGLLDLMMPNLTSLELEQSIRPTKSDGSTAPPLFRNLGKLKSLHLTRVSNYPILSNITSLVELTLEDSTIPFGKFLGILESGLALEIVVLDLEFTKGSVPAVPRRKISLPRLRHLALTSDNATDTRGLLSCVSLPRGIHITVQGSHSAQRAGLASFLPSPPTHIQKLLTSVTAIKYWDNPRRLHLSNDNGTFHFHGPSHETSTTVYEEFELFATDIVREFHLNLSLNHPTNHLSRLLERLPALEVLTISGNPLNFRTLSVLAEEPVLCPSLKTIGFFKFRTTRELIWELRNVLAKRERSIAARLHRVVIIDDTFDLPDMISIRQLQKSVQRVDVVVGDKLPDLL